MILPIILLAQISITTKGFDPQSSGWNSNETTLTQASIKAKGLTRQAQIPVIGDARGMEAQPLIAAGVVEPQVSVPCPRPQNPDFHPGEMQVDNLMICLSSPKPQNIMILPSEANVVRGVVAETGEAIWQTTLGVPITSSPKIDMHSINDHVGCMSTGVYAPPTVYLACWVSQDGSGSPASGQYEMFGLDVATGQQVFQAVNLQTSPLVNEPTKVWKQRASLTYIPSLGPQGTIFIPHGSVYETSAGFTGGIVAFDVASHSVAAYLQMTSGMWMAGAKCPTDGTYLYCLTGNGDFDPANGFYGESLIKILYSTGQTLKESTALFEQHEAACEHAPQCDPVGAPHAVAPRFDVIDQWSPWTDDQRAGGAKLPEGKMAGESLPSACLGPDGHFGNCPPKPVGSSMSMPLKGGRTVVNKTRDGKTVTLVYPPPMANGAWSDEDWGSSGPACFFAISVCVAAGKDGIAYPIRTGSLGGTTVATVGTVANYAKLAAPCVWATVDPGNVPCDPPSASALNFFPNGDTSHLHMSPVQMYDPLLKSWTIFVWGENERLHEWTVSPTGVLSYVAQGNEFASVAVRGRNPGGMAGGFCSGSSNGTEPNSYLLVCVVPVGDANATITQAVIDVYDPIHTVNGVIPLLWTSATWGWNIVDGKFNTPIIWSGQIYYPNFNGSVERLSQ